MACYGFGCAGRWFVEDPFASMIVPGVGLLTTSNCRDYTRRWCGFYVRFRFNNNGGGWADVCSRLAASA
jgi:hypothetical protein